MRREVFISHSSADWAAADQIRAHLEQAGVSCWIAPRDIPPGSEWADAIMAGIAEVRLMVLVHSAETSRSPMVRREVNVALSGATPIMPVRVDDALPQEGLQFYLSSTHWLDAFPAPLEPHLPRITAAAAEMLGRPAAASATPRPGVLRAPPGISFEDRPAVAVLPFRDYRAAGTQDYLAESLTEDLIAAISAWRIFPVIARDSVFALRDNTTDLRLIGRLLNARYLISGSIRRAADQVRVTIELADAETGDAVLSRRFDRRADDPLRLIDEIVLSIGGLLSPELWKRERERAVLRPRASPTAHELVMRGLAERRRNTPEALATAEALFAEALTVDSNDAPALAALSISRNFAAIRRWTDDVPASFRESFDYARRALAADPLNSQCHFAVGLGLMNKGQREEAVAALREAISLNPSYAAARANLGQLFNYLNRPDEALPELELALRLSPQDPYRYQWFPYVAASHYLAGRYADCLTASDEALAANPEYPLATRYRIAALGQLGRIDEAAALLPELRRIDRDFANLEAMTRRLFVPAAADHILEGFRKAGFT